MTLDTQQVKAAFIQEGDFIYIPKDKKFFYVDAVEHIYGKVEAIFEEDYTEEKGLITHKMSFLPEEDLRILTR